jgi:hypothetical protein
VTSRPAWSCCRCWDACGGPLAWRGGLEGAGFGVGEGELGGQHGDVVVEPVAGVGAEPVQQLVGGCLQVGPTQRGGLPVQAEEPAGPVAGFQQPVGVKQQPGPG